MALSSKNNRSVFSARRDSTLLLWDSPLDCVMFVCAPKELIGALTLNFLLLAFVHL